MVFDASPVLPAAQAVDRAGHADVANSRDQTVGRWRLWRQERSDSLEIIAAVAARKAKAPVKITYTREEVFWAHRGRPRTIIDLKTGVKNDGRITSVAAKVIQDGGAYCSYGVVTILYSGALLGALYDIPNIKYDGFRVLTNKPACGAMRGHGTVNVRFAFESQLDEIAAHLKIDPAEIRRRNLLKPPCVTVNNLRVRSYGFPECIEKVVDRSQWN